jgi:hypothetical protein
MNCNPMSNFLPISEPKQVAQMLEFVVGVMSCSDHRGPNPWHNAHGLLRGFQLSCFCFSLIVTITECYAASSCKHQTCQAQLVTEANREKKRKKKKDQLYTVISTTLE